MSKHVDTIKHRPIENNSKNSWDFAISFVIGGSKYLEEINNPQIIPIILMRSIHTACRTLSPQRAENVATIAINSITRISWVTKIQIQSLQ